MTSGTGMRTLQLNGETSGLHRLMKPYVAVLLKKLWADKEEQRDGSGSRSLHEWYNKFATEINYIADSEILPSRSRASIIFEMNALVEQGILGFNDRTGKGGHHRVYYPLMNYSGFRSYAKAIIDKAFENTFAGRWWSL